MPDRAIAPVIGVVLLIVLTVVLAGTVGIYLLLAPDADDAPQAAISATASASADEFRFVHDGGDVIDVSELTIVITIDGEPLKHQPPVPFVGSTGFSGSPSGAFNAAGTTAWGPGERTSFRLACTNDPKVTPGSTVVIDLFVADTPLATIEIEAD